MKNYLLSLFFVCNYFLLISQTDTIIVLTIKTGKIDTILPVPYNTSDTFGITSSSVGNLGNKTPLSLTPPATNVFAGSSFSDIVKAVNVFSLTDYPVRTATALRYYRADSSYIGCSGIIVAPEFVLTAAHCVYNYYNKSFAAADSIKFIPAYNNGQEPAGIPSSYAKRIYIFKSYYDARIWDDAALVELEDPIGIETGWVGIGYSTNFNNYANKVFHKFSYPARPHPANPSKIYNGDTLFYNYGNISVISSFIGINSSAAIGIQGQSGSSFLYTDNTDYYSVGVMSFSNRYLHYPISNKVFYQFQNILVQHPMPVKELTINKQLHVWPNPCGNLLYVQLPEGVSYITARIYNTLGQQVLSTVIGKDMPVSVEQLHAGIYYLNLESEQHLPFQTRFTKN